MATVPRAQNHPSLAGRRYFERPAIAETHRSATSGCRARRRISFAGRVNPHDHQQRSEGPDISTEDMGKSELRWVVPEARRLLQVREVRGRFYFVQSTTLTTGTVS